MNKIFFFPGECTPLFQWHSTVCFREYLFGWPKSPRIFGFFGETSPQTFVTRGLINSYMSFRVQRPARESYQLRIGFCFPQFSAAKIFSLKLRTNQPVLAYKNMSLKDSLWVPLLFGQNEDELPEKA